MYRLCGFAFKGIRTAVEVNGNGTVIYLIGHGKGGVVVIDGADKPQVAADGDGAVVYEARVIVPSGRDHVDALLIQPGNFQNGQHFRKVILHTGYVHLVQNDDMGILIIVSFIHGTEEIRFRIFLCKLVEIAIQLCTLTP